MANIKSAKKRISTNKRQKGENKYVKSTIATLTKSFRELVAEGKLTEAEAKLIETIKYVDSACAKGVLHRNNASRKIARLSATLDQAKKANGVKPAEVKPAKKAEVVAPVEEVKEPKKTTTKKATTTAKKATTKKAPATKAEAKVEEKPAKKATATKAAAKKAPAKKVATATEEKPAKKATTKKAPAKKATK